MLPPALDVAHRTLPIPFPHNEAALLQDELTTTGLTTAAAAAAAGDDTACATLYAEREAAHSAELIDAMGEAICSAPEDMEKKNSTALTRTSQQASRRVT